MTEWREVPLGELVDTTSGGTPRRSNPEYWDGDIPWISGVSLKANRLSTSDRKVTQAAIGNGTRIAPSGAVLILVRGMSLHQEVRVGQAQRDLAFNQDVKALLPGPQITPDFLLYALEGRRETLLNLVHAAGHGTGVLATDRLQTLPIALPPIAEQRRIAAVLGAFDDLIETNQVLIVQLRDQASSIYALASKSGVVVSFEEIADLVRDGVRSADLTAGTPYLAWIHRSAESGGRRGIQRMPF